MQKPVQCNCTRGGAFSHGISCPFHHKKTLAGQHGKRGDEDMDSLCLRACLLSGSVELHKVLRSNQRRLDDSLVYLKELA